MSRDTAASTGTPPRRRGARVDGDDARSESRNSPASAGSTNSPWSMARLASEHPRVGGEHSAPAKGPKTSRGTPPRRRGARVRADQDGVALRNTPASAGSTLLAGRAGCQVVEHPRVGGEHCLDPSVPVPAAGTPPRRRGARLQRRRYLVPGRNTPASAGSTPCRSPCWTRAPEHPRVGGEHIRCCCASTFCCGTPPRRRGARMFIRRDGSLVRNTPASAGSTLWDAGGGRPATEHPRVGGEHTGWSTGWVAARGTPPRRRGAPQHGVRPGERRRNTPASAGSTQAAPGAPRRGPEHPRVGGEHSRRCPYLSLVVGTPPRRRGAQRLQRPGLDRRRNTPASAGSTHRTQAQAALWAEHPRVGGEHSASRTRAATRVGTPPRRRGAPHHQRPHRQPRRNTPASAGSTPVPRGCGSSGPEHPRVGGEHATGPAIPVRRSGTPPRRRGARFGPAGTRDRYRNTPASAGSTARTTRRCGCTPEHPRVGGEHDLGTLRASQEDGTPPRRRGAREGPAFIGGAPRNTPASAGSTSGRRPCCCCRAEHPRVGGEHSGAGAALVSLTGTPPRRRGARRHSGPRPRAPRNTPASAGSTTLR